MSRPQHPLFIDPNGKLYGTEEGPARLGISQIARWNGRYSVVCNFDNVANGAPPQGVVRDPDGNFFSVTNEGGTYDDGVIFEVVQ